MNKYIIIALLIATFTVKMQSQESKKDSLTLKLHSASLYDKVGLYLQLSDLADSYTESINYCAKALNIANELKNIGFQADINFEMGIVHYSEGKYMYSEKRFLEALSFYQQRNDSISIASTYYRLALCDKNWEKYRNAIKYAQLGLGLNERLKSINGIMEITLASGFIYQAHGDQKEAEIYFNKALKAIDRKIHNSNLAFALLGKGNVFFALSKKDSAKIMFNESYKIFLDLKNAYGQALCLRDQANYYISEKDYNKAELSIDKSLGLFKSIKNKRGIFEVLVLKGDLYFKKGNYTRAIELYLAGQKLAMEMQLQEETVKNFKTISKVYEAQKDLAKSLKYYKLYTELKDSVVTSETLEQLSEMQNKYETEKNEKENNLLRIDNELKHSIIEKQYILVLSIIIVLGLTIALAVIFFKGRQRERENNQIMEQQKEEIEFSHQQITTSINYASRIQGALLPETILFKNSIKDHFVLYKPRDIVSGDFYWIKQIKNQLVIAVADCTGHGVPGAFMSLLGISFLTEIMSRQIIPNANEILEKLREMIKVSLKQDNLEQPTKDGMDMALCIINTDSLKMQYAGANMPLYLIRKGNLEIVKGTNNPIGIYLKEKPFENQQIQLMPDDNIYLFSDGYVDQFGGKKGGKFKHTHFREALLAIYHSNMSLQKQLLEDIFEEWKNSAYDQTDDVLVLGMKI